MYPVEKNKVFSAAQASFCLYPEVRQKGPGPRLHRCNARVQSLRAVGLKTVSSSQLLFILNGLGISNLICAIVKNYSALHCHWRKRLGGRKKVGQKEHDKNKHNVVLCEN